MVLPWLAEAINRNPFTVDHLTDCAKCMDTTTKEQRQAMGCGYEPTNPLIVAVPWDHKGRNGERLRFCPGYTAKLPVVTEASRLRLHWSNGAVASVLDGEPLHEHTQIAIELLERTWNEVESWRMRPAEKGGGGK